MANPESGKKRSKLVLPAPQISDMELEEVSGHDVEFVNSHCGCGYNRSTCTLCGHNVYVCVLLIVRSPLFM